MAASGQPAVAPHEAARHELLSALVLAAATILTAFAAFQSATWVATQTREGNAAAATRLESTRSSNTAAAAAEVDATMWTAWVNAVLAEQRADPGRTLTPDGRYVPAPDSVSSFYYARFRSEFRIALDAWLARNPFNDPTAAKVPFAVPEYQLAELHRADRLARKTEQHRAEAETAGDRGRAYIMLTVIFAAALGFAGVGTKFLTRWARVITLAVAGGMVVIAFGVMVLTLPIKL
jgi:hypothetical protein